MAIEKIEVADFLKLAAKFPVIDVRSPGEYRHAHIPGAINMPLFNDEERKVVGTLYKQRSREDAIKSGLDFFGPKMRGMVEQAEALSHDHSKTLLVHCWRGGMRSGAIAWLFDLYGFKIITLKGGYKSYRNFVLNLFSKPLLLHVIGGYTGSGKTEILKALEQAGQPIIDLEDLANHKGSAFGNIDMPDQPSQEMFDNLLAARISGLENAGIIWVEDESQRIGHVNIPMAFWQQMRTSPIHFFDIPFEQRLDHLVQEYGNLDKQRMHDAITRIRKRLGPLETKMSLAFLAQNDMRACFEILLKYYDKYYIKALHNREQIDSLIQVFKSNKVSPANATLLLKQPETHENH